MTVATELRTGLVVPHHAQATGRSPHASSWHRHRHNQDEQCPHLSYLEGHHCPRFRASRGAGRAAQSIASVPLVLESVPHLCLGPYPGPPERNIRTTITLTARQSRDADSASGAIQPCRETTPAIPASLSACALVTSVTESGHSSCVIPPVPRTRCRKAWFDVAIEIAA